MINKLSNSKVASFKEVFLVKDDFYRDTWMEVRLDAITNNVKAIKSLIPDTTELMAVVKANGYGHGAVEVAETALEAGASALAVAILDEALFLRKKGINAPILVLGYCPVEYAHIAAENNISLTVFQKEWLTAVKEDLTAPLNIHIKCDTGMGRIGVQTVDEFQEILQIVNDEPLFTIEGIFTHFANADTLDDRYYQEQLQRFNEFLTVLKEKPRWVHASNSAATLMHRDGLFNLVRSGISLYGLTPSLEIKGHLPVQLEEAFSLHSKLIHIKKVKKGTKISYGSTYEASDEEWIGTIPIGYADGWLRALQGQTVLVDGERVPIVGRVCMDQCMIRLPKYVPVGTQVTLIGQQFNEQISVDEIAEKLQTINYEVVCMISNRVPRIYKDGDRIVGISNPLHI